MKLCKYVHFQFVEFKFYSSRWIVFQNIYSATSSPINSIGLNVRASVDYFSQYLATRLAGKLENLICVRWHLKKNSQDVKADPDSSELSDDDENSDSDEESYEDYDEEEDGEVGFMDMINKKSTLFRSSGLQKKPKESKFLFFRHASVSSTYPGQSVRP